MFTSDYAESSLSCTLAGLWMTEKGWIKGTVNHTACWAHSASNIQNQHILQIYQWFYDGFWSPKPLVAMVFQWFLVQKPLLAMVFQWFLVTKTIGSNGFPMVFGSKNEVGCVGPWVLFWALKKVLKRVKTLKKVLSRANLLFWVLKKVIKRVGLLRVRRTFLMWLLSLRMANGWRHTRWSWLPLLGKNKHPLIFMRGIQSKGQGWWKIY